MATIDIDRIVGDKLASMNSSGLIQTKIEENIEKTVLSAIENTFGSYSLRNMISDKLKKQLPSIVDGIGLDGYAHFLAETIQKTVIAGMQADAKRVLTESVTDIFCKRYDKYRLTDIIKEWKHYVDPEDEDERVERNEEHDGFTCRICKREGATSSVVYYTIFLDELGDHPVKAARNEFEFVIEVRDFGYSFSPGAAIEHIYIYGSDIVNNIRDVRGSFRSLLANLYLNRTPIVMNLGEFDANDHYYETESDR